MCIATVATALRQHSKGRDGVIGTINGEGQVKQDAQNEVQLSVSRVFPSIEDRETEGRSAQRK